MITKQEYIEALERMEESYYNFDGCMSAMNKFKEDVNLLYGLVNEHFEEKSETNLEFYYDDLLEEGFSNFGVANGKIESCTFISCKKCEFESGNCRKDRITWLLSQRKKPKYKFTQFEYDLLQSYSDIYSFNAFNSLSGMKEKGYFKDVDEDATIEDILAKCEVVG